MPYTDADFERMETDRAFSAQYWWHMGMVYRKRAAKGRTARVRGFALSGPLESPEFFERMSAACLEMSQFEINALPTSEGQAT